MFLTFANPDEQIEFVVELFIKHVDEMKIVAKLAWPNQMFYKWFWPNAKYHATIVLKSAFGNHNVRLLFLGISWILNGFGSKIITMRQPFKMLLLNATVSGGGLLESYVLPMNLAQTKHLFPKVFLNTTLLFCGFVMKCGVVGAAPSVAQYEFRSHRKKCSV